MSDLAYMHGALTALCVVVALVFARLWRRAHDRFYLLFTIAFVLFGASWVALGLGSREHALYAYMTRLLAFMTILFAVIDKNRRGE